MYEGTAKSMKGMLADECYEQAKNEGCKMEVVWQDGDSSAATSISQHHPTGNGSKCGGHVGRAHTNNLKEDANRKEFSEDVKTSQSTMYVISILGKKMVYVTFSPRKHAVARNVMRRKPVALGSHTKQKSVKCNFHWLHSSTSVPFKKLVTGINVFSVSSRTPLNVFFLFSPEAISKCANS